MEQFMKIVGEQIEERLAETSVVTALWAKGIINLEQKQAIGDLRTIVSRRRLVEILSQIEDNDNSAIDVLIEIVESKCDGRPAFIQALKDARGEVLEKSKIAEPSPIEPVKCCAELIQSPASFSLGLLCGAILPILLYLCYSI